MNNLDRQIEHARMALEAAAVAFYAAIESRHHDGLQGDALEACAMSLGRLLTKRDAQLRRVKP